MAFSVDFLGVLAQGQPVETTSKLYFTLVHARMLRNEYLHVNINGISFDIIKTLKI